MQQAPLVLPPKKEADPGGIAEDGGVLRVTLASSGFPDYFLWGALFHFSRFAPCCISIHHASQKTSFFATPPPSFNCWEEAV